MTIELIKGFKGRNDCKSMNAQRWHLKMRNFVRITKESAALLLYGVN
jgi:hypothetical protein